MKAWVLEKTGTILNSLKLSTVDTIQPQEGEVLVKVKATAVNRLDTYMSETAKIKNNEPFILGVEFSGEVVANHSNLSHFSKGTRVMGLVENGAFAEYVSVDARRLMLIPESLDWNEATAIPENFITAYQTIYWLGKLEKKEKILVHAAGSGVGTAAIQLANKLSHAQIFATAGTTEKLDKAKSLGAEVTINYKKEAFDELILDYTDKKGVDVILDFVGAQNWQANLNTIAVDGRWVLIGTLGGDQVEGLDLRAIMQKRLSLVGTLLNPRSADYKASLSQEFIQQVGPYLNERTIRPVIHQVLPFDELVDAYHIMENNENLGKIVINFE